MNSILELFVSQSAAHAVIIISIVAALGLALGNVRVLGVNFGIAGVLFSGIIFGHFRITINREIMEFLREFGLILFVYTIGMQVGPGFFSSLKKEGLRLNMLAAAVVVLGAGLAILVSRLFDIDMAAAVGMYSGATTNTPSLAAAQQALKEAGVTAQEIIKLPGIGYAVSYPFGIVGIILTMILVRLIFRIDPSKEAVCVESAKAGFMVLNIKVENKNLDGLTIGKIPALAGLGVRISRIFHENRVSVAQPDTVIRLGDIILAVGPGEKLSELALVVGRPSEVDIASLPSRITSARIIVTKKEVLGRRLSELDLESGYGVIITRAARAEIEFIATADYTLQFGDTLMAVGEEDAIRKVSVLLGNSPGELSHPQLIPVFVGIALGIMAGSVPVSVPGAPAGVRLGLAGGPLVIAILLSRVRKIGPLSWYMPISANFMLRELGIILFLACVGLGSGDSFVSTLTKGDGLRWMACASLITFIPLFATAVFARMRYGLNYLSLCGLLAGSMTDPPALSFANSMAASGATSISYATVYPLVMLMRVVSAQILVLSFMK